MLNTVWTILLFPLKNTEKVRQNIPTFLTAFSQCFPQVPILFARVPRNPVLQWSVLESSQDLSMSIPLSTNYWCQSRCILPWDVLNQEKWGALLGKMILISISAMKSLVLVNSFGSHSSVLRPSDEKHGIKITYKHGEMEILLTRIGLHTELTLKLPFKPKTTQHQKAKILVVTAR